MNEVGHTLDGPRYPIGRDLARLDNIGDGAHWSGPGWKTAAAGRTSAVLPFRCRGRGLRGGGSAGVSSGSRWTPGRPDPASIRRYIRLSRIQARRILKSVVKAQA